MLPMAIPVPKTRMKIEAPQPELFVNPQGHPSKLVRKLKPFYRTSAGAAYLGDSLDI